MTVMSSTNAKLIARIVEQYRTDPLRVARAFDEQIDRSGNSLGWLRTIAITPPITGNEGEGS